MNARSEKARRKARAVALLGSQAALTAALAVFVVAEMALLAAPIGLLP